MRFEVESLRFDGWMLVAGGFLGIVRTKGTKGAKGTKGCFTGASREGSA